MHGPDSPSDPEYLDVHQHWCPYSEKFGGGDCLLTAIMRGWELDRRVYVETKWFNNSRHTTVYHCRLTRGGETLDIPVIENPYVSRLIWQRKLIRIGYDGTPESTREMQAVAAIR